MGQRLRQVGTRDSDAVRAALTGCERVVYQPQIRDGDAPNETLDRATRGTYVLATEAAKAGVQQIVLHSTLAFFARHPRNWHVEANWRPFPAPDVVEMGAWLAELSLREVVRAAGLHGLVLRFGTEINGTVISEDARRQAIQTALSEPLPDAPHSWLIRHVGEWNARPAGDEGRAWRDVLAPPAPIPERPVRRVVIFGAGGPIAAALAQELAPHYELILSDLRSLADVAGENKPQSPGAPVAHPLAAPHEERQADIRDYKAVLAVCEGADAILNCSVLRHDPIDAFRVNTLGFYNVCRAAVTHNIRRVVQTGPQMLNLHGENDYRWDFDIAGDAPARPGRHLYGHSKFLGNEIGRVFAEWHDLHTPTLLYNHFASPAVPLQYGSPMMISYDDAARSIRAALEVSSLPNPYEEFHICVDNPHRYCRTDRARLLLGWQAQDLLETTWKEGKMEEKKQP